ncbi:MAG TPA: hypothetical protein VIU64_02095 [Polyangia bacterium]
MSDPSTSSPSGGISRFVGVGLSLITGFVVFTVGVSLFPIEPPRPPEPPQRLPTAPIAAAAPSPETAPGAGGAPAQVGPPDGGAAEAPAVTPAADGGVRPTEPGKPAPDKGSRADTKATAATTKAAAPSARVEDAATTDAESAPAPIDAGTDASAAGGAGGSSASADEAGAASSSAPVADCTLSDEEIAREAGRRKSPTVCPVAETKSDAKGETKGEPKKAFLIIPIKGSVENAASELKRKPFREARVTLPAAESQLSQKQYKLRRLGFKDLKIGPPDEGSGTRIRVRLMNGAGDPAFEIKDGYAKITVLAPATATATD